MGLFCYRHDRPTDCEPCERMRKNCKSIFRKLFSVLLLVIPLDCCSLPFARELVLFSSCNMFRNQASRVQLALAVTFRMPQKESNKKFGKLTSHKVEDILPSGSLVVRLLCAWPEFLEKFKHLIFDRISGSKFSFFFWVPLAGEPKCERKNQFLSKI